MPKKKKKKKKKRKKKKKKKKKRKKKKKTRPVTGERLPGAGINRDELKEIPTGQVKESVAEG